MNQFYVVLVYMDSEILPDSVEKEKINSWKRKTILVNEEKLARIKY